MNEQLKTITETMICNGYAYFNEYAFISQSEDICYVPENAKTIDDTYNYSKLKKAVKNWASDNQEYLQEHETTIEAILINMFETIQYEFPETFLAQLN